MAQLAVCVPAHIMLGKGIDGRRQWRQQGIDRVIQLLVVQRFRDIGIATGSAASILIVFHQVSFMLAGLSLMINIVAMAHSFTASA
jgi:hypothetical protein